MTTILICPTCGWHSDPGLKLARTDKCDRCRTAGLNFVTYDPRTETEEVRRIVVANAARAVWQIRWDANERA